MATDKKKPSRGSGDTSAAARQKKLIDQTVNDQVDANVWYPPSRTANKPSIGVPKHEKVDPNLKTPPANLRATSGEWGSRSFGKAIDVQPSPHRTPDFGPTKRRGRDISDISDVPNLLAIGAGVGPQGGSRRSSSDYISSPTFSPNLSALSPARGLPPGMSPRNQLPPGGAQGSALRVHYTRRGGGSGRNSGPTSPQRGGMASPPVGGQWEGGGSPMLWGELCTSAASSVAASPMMSPQQGPANSGRYGFRRVNSGMASLDLGATASQPLRDPRAGKSSPGRVLFDPDANTLEFEEDEYEAAPVGIAAAWMDNDDEEDDEGVDVFNQFSPAFKPRAGPGGQRVGEFGLRARAKKRNMSVTVIRDQHGNKVEKLVPVDEAEMEERDRLRRQQYLNATSVLLGLQVGLRKKASIFLEFYRSRGHIWSTVFRTKPMKPSAHHKISFMMMKLKHLVHGRIERDFKIRVWEVKAAKSGKSLFAFNNEPKLLGELVMTLEDVLEKDRYEFRLEHPEEDQSNKKTRARPTKVHQHSMGRVLPNLKKMLADSRDKLSANHVTERGAERAHNGERALLGAVGTVSVQECGLYVRTTSIYCKKGEPYRTHHATEFGPERFDQLTGCYVKFEISAEHLRSVSGGVKGLSPRMHFFRRDQSDERWDWAGASDRVRNTRDPNFGQNCIGLHALCYGDLDRPILICCMHGKAEIGTFMSTLRRLIKNPKHNLFKNERGASKKRAQSPKSSNKKPSSPKSKKGKDQVDLDGSVSDSGAGKLLVGELTFKTHIYSLGEDLAAIKYKVKTSALDTPSRRGKSNRGSPLGSPKHRSNYSTSSSNSMLSAHDKLHSMQRYYANADVDDGLGRRHKAMTLSAAEFHELKKQEAKRKKKGKKSPKKRNKHQTLDADQIQELMRGSLGGGGSRGRH